MVRSSYGSVVPPTTATTDPSAPSQGMEKPLLGASGGGTSPEYPPVSPAAEPGAVVPRELLLRALIAKRERALHCRSVPCSLITYTLFILAIVLRAQVGVSYSVESELLVDVVQWNGGFYPTCWYDWFSYVTGTLIGPNNIAAAAGNGVLRFQDINSVPLPPTQLGFIGANRALIIGGIRLSQTRYQAAPCPIAAASIVSLYNSTCYLSDTLSTAPFGQPAVAEALYNDTAVAFTATTVAGDPTEQPAVFQFFLDTGLPHADLIRPVNALQAGYWLDAGTNEVSIEFATLHGDVGMFGRVEMTATFNLGGRVTWYTNVASVPIDPYYGSGWVTACFDIFLLIYWLYLALGTARRLVTGCRNTARGPGYASRLISAVFNYWRLLDMAVVISFLVTICAWFTLVGRLVSLRKYLADAAPPPGSTFPPGPSPVESYVEHATMSEDVFVTSATATLILLTLRLFKYFAYQPRLAVISDTFKASCSEMAHFGIIFGIILAMFGVWGHFAFGAQAFDWRDVQTSIVSVFRFSMYDYDLPAMEASYPVMADLFFTLFMLIVTNLALWLFFAVVFDVYTDVRKQAWIRGESAFVQLAGVVYDLPKQLPSYVNPRNWGSRGGYTFSAGGRPAPTHAQRDATWGELSSALSVGPLAEAEFVSSAGLQATLGISEWAADEAIAEVHSSSAAPPPPAAIVRGGSFVDGEGRRAVSRGASFVTAGGNP